MTCSRKKNGCELGEGAASSSTLLLVLVDWINPRGVGEGVASSSRRKRLGVWILGEWSRRGASGEQRQQLLLPSSNEGNYRRGG